MVACGVADDTIYSLGTSGDATRLEWERLNIGRIKEGWKIGVLQCPPLKLRRGDGGVLLNDKKFLVFGNKFAL